MAFFIVEVGEPFCGAGGEVEFKDDSFAAGFYGEFGGFSGGDVVSLGGVGLDVVEFFFLGVVDHAPALGHDDGEFVGLGRYFAGVGSAEVLLDEMGAGPVFYLCRRGGVLGRGHRVCSLR